MRGTGDLPQGRGVDAGGPHVDEQVRDAAVLEAVEVGADEQDGEAVGVAGTDVHTF